MRTLAAAIALGLGLAAVQPVPARDTVLPDFGSSAAGMVDPAMEAQYGAYMLHELRRMGAIGLGTGSGHAKRLGNTLSD